MLMSFHESGVASSGELDEDLATVLLIASAFHQPAFFEAIYRTHNGRRIDSQPPSNRTDCAGFSLLRLLDQPQYHELRRAKPLLVSMFESCSQDFAQI